MELEVKPYKEGDRLNAPAPPTPWPLDVLIEEISAREQRVRDAHEELARRRDELNSFLAEQLGVTNHEEASIQSVVRLFARLLSLKGKADG